MTKRRFAGVLSFPLALVTLAFAPAVARATGITLLHEFAGGASDGSAPMGSLTTDGASFYGMTVVGGANDWGTAFRMNLDGSGFSLIHSFSLESWDGYRPNNTLAFSASKLYGTASTILFSMGTDGSGFTNLHTFNGGSNGSYPDSTPTVNGTVIYGMTSGGGSVDRGIVYKVNTDGTGFTMLHNFVGGVLDGGDPRGSLLISGSTIYGLTYRFGSAAAGGIVFKMETNGTGYTILHKFQGGATDGAYPYGALSLIGGTLYGLTEGGGVSNTGTIFKIGTDGAGFSVLHSFLATTADGGYPDSMVAGAGSFLFGTTSAGGTNGGGTVFQIGTNGTGYSVLHHFMGGASDGQSPGSDAPVLMGNTLYGMSAAGGDSNLGTVWALEVASIPEPSTVILAALGVLGLGALRRR